jgi:hypothetical protein
MVRWLLDHGQPLRTRLQRQSAIGRAGNGHTVIVEMLRPYRSDQKGDLVDVTQTRGDNPMSAPRRKRFQVVQTGTRRTERRRSANAEWAESAVAKLILQRRRCRF